MVFNNPTTAQIINHPVYPAILFAGTNAGITSGQAVKLWPNIAAFDLRVSKYTTFTVELRSVLEIRETFHVRDEALSRCPRQPDVDHYFQLLSSVLLPLVVTIGASSKISPEPHASVNNPSFILLHSFNSFAGCARAYPSTL